MTWIKFFFSLIAISAALNLRVSTNTKSQRYCNKCISGDYGLANLCFGTSKYKKEMRISPGLKASCMDKSIPLEPCDGHCVDVILTDEHDTDIIKGIIAGCSADLVDSNRSKQALWSFGDSIQIDVSRTASQHRYIFTLRKEEKNINEVEVKPEEPSKPAPVIPKVNLDEEYQLKENEINFILFILSVLILLLIAVISGTRPPIPAQNTNRTTSMTRAANRAAQRFQRI
ncbi:hypothetical protein B9Z55_005944 [Caenorhabditis nigoni]|uniref:Uncharacterized protein n=1 Tax=Caenorhabditis nigoni TaxID=1611254 RepID=A0A2G5V2Z6_9PELO|nr:hypothetical protein B9Z55_005944 [Caenorhabditis nigoni]